MQEPERLVELAAEMGPYLERYLKWKQIVDRYERGRHSKLGQIINDLRGKEGVPKTVELLKLYAQATEEFVQYLSEWDEAEKKMIRARVEYDTRKNLFDAIQSSLAFRRESIKHGVMS